MEHLFHTCTKKNNVDTRYDTHRSNTTHTFFISKTTLIVLCELTHIDWPRDRPFKKRRYCWCDVKRLAVAAALPVHPLTQMFFDQRPLTEQKRQPYNHTRVSLHRNTCDITGMKISFSCFIQANCRYIVEESVGDLWPASNLGKLFLWIDFTILRIGMWFSRLAV